jgi:hypothetical protein
LQVPLQQVIINVRIQPASQTTSIASVRTIDSGSQDSRKTELLVCKSQTGTSKKNVLKNTTGEAEKTPKRRQIDR